MSNWTFTVKKAKQVVLSKIKGGKTSSNDESG